MIIQCMVCNVEPSAQCMVCNVEPSAQCMVCNVEPSAQCMVCNVEPSAQCMVCNVEPSAQCMVCNVEIYQSVLGSFKTAESSTKHGIHHNNSPQFFKQQCEYLCKQQNSILSSVVNEWRLVKSLFSFPLFKLHICWCNKKTFWIFDQNILLLTSSSSHCWATLDLKIGVEQPFNCFIVQNHQAVQSIRSMDWTLEDHMADGLFFCTTLTGRRGEHTPFVRAGTEMSDLGANAVTPGPCCSWGVIQGGWVPVSWVKVLSLLRLSNHSPPYHTLKSCIEVLLCNSKTR